MGESMITRLKEQLMIDEGYRQHPYHCTEGFLTVAYGRNLQTKGISKEEAEYLLENDIGECLNDLRQLFDNFDVMPEDVQYVLANMRFQLGGSGLRRFKNFIKAIKLSAWMTAAYEMINSKWYTQTTNRAERLVQVMKGVS